MATGKKTDNARLGSKLALRRHFLRRYHARGARPLVFDACQGYGTLWKRLREEFDVMYWGVDKKHGRARLSMDSTRVLAAPGWSFDIIDVDTYGAPWEHWESILRNGRKDLTVFLTIGAVSFGGATNAAALRALGLAPIARHIPTAMRGQLTDRATEYALAQAFDYGWDVIECQEAPPNRATRYMGLRIIKRAA